MISYFDFELIYKIIHKKTSSLVECDGVSYSWLNPKVTKDQDLQQTGYFLYYFAAKVIKCDYPFFVSVW